MRGSTRKRGKTWTCYWDAVDSDGERKQKSKGGFTRQKDAERFLQDTLPKVTAGTYVEPSRDLVTGFLLSWIKVVEPQVKPLTALRYRRTIEYQLIPRIGHIQLAKLTPGDVLELLASLAACRDPQHDHREGDCRGLAASSQRVIFAVLSRALSDAVRWEKLARNPAAQVTAPASSDTRVVAWTDGELRRFLDHVADDRLAALWRLAATTGMRRGELLGLRWADVDLDGETLRVERQALPTPGGVTFGTPKSRRGRRGVTLDPGTVEALAAHQARQISEQTAAGDLYQHADLVFADEIGRPTHPNALSNQFIVRRRAAGVPVGSIHVLRHTAATMALTAGIPVHVVAARLGDRPETVLGTYAHLLPRSDRAAADVVVAALGG